MANRHNIVNVEPLLPPIHLHVKTLRPKVCDIAWEPPIQLNNYKLGYNIQVFKEEYEENKAIQDWSISTTTWQLSNLEPRSYYEVHIHSFISLPATNQIHKSQQPIVMTFCTAPTQKQDKKMPPDPPEAAKEIAIDDQRLRNPKRQKDNEIIAWKSPEKFRGKISYKILWNNDLLGVTDNPFVDLGDKNRVRIKFEYMHQQKKKAQLDDDSMHMHMDDDGYNNEEEDDDDYKYNHNNNNNININRLNEIKLTFKSQTFYKGQAAESSEKCEVKLEQPFINNEIEGDIKWEDMYQHDKDFEQIVIWLYLETKSTDKWQVQPQKNEEQNIELVKIGNILNMNESLFVAVWRKPFCRHLNNFFNIGTKQEQQQVDENDNEANNNQYDDLDTTPKRDPSMNGFFLRAKQRAIVIQYCRKTGFFGSIFGGQDNRRENIFTAMLKTMLNKMKNDDEDDDDEKYNENNSELFTFHDCNATIEWIFGDEWSEKGDSLQNVLHNVFSAELKRMLDHTWNENEYDDKCMKQLLLMFYWLFKLFAHRFRSHWMIGIMQKLITYINLQNNQNENNITVFEYLNKIYGKQLIWKDKRNCMMKFLTLHARKKQKTFIKEFLPAVLWYNVCWNCALIADKHKNIAILTGIHDKDKNDLQQRFSTVQDKLKMDKKLFDVIVSLNDECDYKENKQCIDFRSVYFKEILFKPGASGLPEFLTYLKHVLAATNIDSFSKLLNVYCTNISNYISNDFDKWREYLKHIYLLLQLNGHGQINQQQISVLNNAIKPIYTIIVSISRDAEADGLCKLISELPASYDKTNILMQILLNNNSYLLFKHADKFVDLIVEIILLRQNNVNLRNTISIDHALNGKRISIKTYNKFAEYHLQVAIEYWISSINKRYAINMVNKHNIGWKILSKTFRLIIEKCTLKRYGSQQKDDDDLNMKSFGAMIDFMIDNDIPIVGRKAMVHDLISFWRENVKNKNKFLNKLYMILFQLLFATNCTNKHNELYDAIIKEFRNISPYNQYFYQQQTITPMDMDMDDEKDDEKDESWDDEKFNNFRETTLSRQFLRISSCDCRLVMNQESFYRFNKTLQDCTNPFRQTLLLKESGIYYLMGILMNRLNENNKSAFFFQECLQKHVQKEKKEKKIGNNTLKAFCLSDIALRYYYNNKQQESIKYIREAMNLCGEGYINLINSIINGKEKAVVDVIKYLDTNTLTLTNNQQDEENNYKESKQDESVSEYSNYSFFGRFTYCRWLTKHGQYDKAKNEYDIIIKYNENNENKKINVMNGLIYYEYGELLSNHKQNDEAKKQFHTALKIKPCLPNIHESCNDKLKELDEKHNPNHYPYNDRIINVNRRDSDIKDDNDNDSDDDVMNDLNDLAFFDSQDEEFQTQSAQQTIPFTGKQPSTGTFHP